MDLKKNVSEKYIDNGCDEIALNKIAEISFVQKFHATKNCNGSQPRGFCARNKSYYRFTVHLSIRRLTIRTGKMYKRFHVGLWQTSELHYIRKIDTE